MAKGEDMKEEIEVLYTEQEIEDKVKELAAKIDEDYKGKAIHLICVLKGGAMFMCDLAKRLKNPLVTMDFMAVSSYGNSTESSGVVRIVKDLDEPLEGRHCGYRKNLKSLDQTFAREKSRIS